MGIDWKKEGQGKTNPVFENCTLLMEFVEWKRSESKSSKAPQIEVDWTACEDDNPLGGETFRDWMSLSSAALWRIAAMVKACGINTDTLPEMEINSEEFGKVLNMLKGRKALLQFEQETYQSTTRSKIKAFFLYEDQPAPPDFGEDNVPEFIKNKVKAAGLK